MFVLSVNLYLTHTYAADFTQETKTVPLWLVLRLRDYNTRIAVANISVSAKVHTDWGTKTINSMRTNETGVVAIYLGKIEAESSFKTKRLLEIELSDNYTLIKVQNVFVEDSSLSTRNYKAYYVPNYTRHEGLRIDLSYKVLERQHLIEGNIWVLKGKLVKVLDCDPVTGEKEPLIATPAFKTDIPTEENGFVSYYFFPLNYEVTIFDRTKAWTNDDPRRLRYGEDPVSPLTVKVDENTTLINWMFHAAEEYVQRETYRIDKEMEWLRSAGYQLLRENEEYNAVKSLMRRVLELYQKGECVSALGGAKISYQKLAELTKWISDLKTLAVLTTVGISLFAYGLSSLLSSFFFEEPSENKIRLGTKVLAFSLIMLVFAFSHPSLKIAFSLLIGSRSVTLPISLLGCFTISGLTYFFIQLFSLRRGRITDLSLQLGVRSLKRRRSRTLLTLLTISIVVSAAIVFVNISVNRTTKIKNQWDGTDIPGVIVKPNTDLAPVSEYDVNWIRSQEWCADLGYREEIKHEETTEEKNVIMRTGLLKIGEETRRVDIVCIDPLFMKNFYNITERIRSLWSEFQEGEPVAILPSTFMIAHGEYVNLEVEVTYMSGLSEPLVEIESLGEFRVVGTFDPAIAFNNLTKIDNTPLFEDPTNMILVPLASINSPSFSISEITILTKQGFDPVKIAEELAYSMAAVTVANENKLAQEIVWSTEFSISGLIPYIPPLVIAGLMMYTTMVSVYEERRREFTTLAALGLDPRNMFQVFLVEALLLGLMGTFIGFFGSYLLGFGLFYLTLFMGVSGLPVMPLSSMQWSMPAILVALLTGVIMVFLGGYVPAMKAKGLSLMGRKQKREMIGEFVSSDGTTSFTLPIRETVQNSDMLYMYIRETIGKFKSSLVDSHSVKGEIYRDGTFTVSFVAMGDGFQVFIPCEIKGTREGDVLVPVIQFPTSYKSYRRIREIIRDLEQYMIEFSAWKEMQIKMTIVREAPRKRKTIEEILAEIKDVIDQIKDCNKKLKILESQKGKLSEEVYNEFREKYAKMIEEKSKTLRSMTINLEPHHTELRNEIEKIEVDIERITTSYNLGEITEEEYVKTCGPLQGRLAELKVKVQEMEEIFDFLKKPLGREYT